MHLKKGSVSRVGVLGWPYPLIFSRLSCRTTSSEALRNVWHDMPCHLLRACGLFSDLGKRPNFFGQATGARHPRRDPYTTRPASSSSRTTSTHTHQKPPSRPHRNDNHQQVVGTRHQERVNLSDACPQASSHASVRLASSQACRLLTPSEAEREAPRPETLRSWVREELPIVVALHRVEAMGNVHRHFLVALVSTVVVVDEAQRACPEHDRALQFSSIPSTILPRVC